MTETVEEALRGQPSIAAAARVLGIPARTLQDRVKRGVYSGPSSATSLIEEVPVFFRDYSHLDELYVYPLGDVHIGSRMHDRERWEEWLRYLEETPHASLLGTGDFLNSGIIGSKSEVYDEVHTVGGAKRLLKEDLTTLAALHRVDLLLPGNHEDRVYRAVGDCPIQDVAEDLGINYTRAAALLVYKVGNLEYEVYVRHGTGNGQALVQLAKSAQVARADVYITGHTHRQAVTADEFFVRHGDQMRRERRYFVSSGSFLAYENYAAARGYVPTRLGAPRIHLNGERRDTHVSI